MLQLVGPGTSAMYKSILYFYLNLIPILTTLC